LKCSSTEKGGQVTVRIQSGSTEPIEVLVVDAAGTVLPGLANIKIRIRRLSDGFHFDWSDQTFKASPTTLLQTLVAADASKSPGEYHLDTAPHTKGWHTALITNKAADDTYFVTVVQDGGSDADNVPMFGEIKEGGFIDRIEAMPTHSLEMSFSYDPATDILTGNVWLESANLTVSTPGSLSLTLYDEDGTAQLGPLAAASADAQGVFKVTANPTGLVKNRAYYAEATVTLPAAAGTVNGVKGMFTIGS
jgi:hypothetical protein